jgi:hypothetical protein
MNLKEFLDIIKKEILNYERHALYPCTIIDISKNFIKSVPETAQKFLTFFVE